MANLQFFIVAQRFPLLRIKYRIMPGTGGFPLLDKGLSRLFCIGESKSGRYNISMISIFKLYYSRAPICMTKTRLLDRGESNKNSQHFERKNF